MVEITLPASTAVSGVGTYSELKSTIQDFLNRDDLATAVDVFIDLAEARMQREIRHYKMEAITQLTATTQYTTLPSDFLQPIRLSINSTGRTLEAVSRENLQDRRYATNDTAQEPRFYGITDGQLELYPTPSESFAVNLLYYQKIPPLEALAPTNWLLEDSPDVYLYGALIHSAPYLADDPRTTIWAALYQAAVDGLKKSSEDTKWGGGGLNLRAPKYGIR